MQMIQKLGRGSIKESFDHLPSGICFADKYGVIILCNYQMHRLCHALMGSDIQHIFELRGALKNPAPGISFADDAGNVLRFPDGQVWEFREESVTDANGKTYAQIQAFPMTQLYAKKAELEQENQKLEQVNQRARRLSKELDQTVREEETFALKMRVHNDIGLCLLTTRRTLTEQGALDELQQAGKLWRQKIPAFAVVDFISYDDLKNGQEAATSLVDPLRELIDSSAGLGVKITLNGILPEDSKLAYLLVTAMRECATNTVRHARGTEMTVTLFETARSISAQITNNGQQPKGEIREGGGLTDLRRRIEKAGGSMHIKSTPIYQLSMTLPRKEETSCSTC